MAEKSKGEQIKDALKVWGFNESVIAEKLNIARQTLNQIDKRKYFDNEFLINLKKATGGLVDFTIDGNMNSFKEEEVFYKASVDDFTISLNLKGNLMKTTELPKLIESIRNQASEYGFKLI